MPCKIQIRKNIRGQVEAKTDSGFNRSLPAANGIADAVNKSFGFNVVKFSQNSAREIIRDINIPEKLVDKYFLHELKIEEKEAAKVQKEDAQRAGVEYTDDYMFQTEETVSSTASPETIAIIKDFLKRIGVDIKGVNQIVQNGVKVNANGMAMLAQQLVQVVEGKEDVALTEEAMHFAVEIIQQKDPKLFNKLLREVNNYNLTKTVMKDYASVYLTADGKPDIIKIKKEAIGKILAEVVIRNNEGFTEKPELLEQSKSLWQEILSFLREIFSTSGFDEASMKIVSGEAVGTADDVRREGVYLQQTKLTSEEQVKSFFNVVQGTSDRMTLEDKDPKDRHYTLDGKRVLTSVTKKIKAAFGKEFKRTPLQKEMDDMKQSWGSIGHKYFQDFFGTLFDKTTGLKYQVPTEEFIETELSQDVKESVENMAINIINSYAPGTRFLAEPMVVNEKYKGGIGSAIDFMAIEPVRDSFMVDILDWKFTTNDTTINRDVQWYKQKEWIKQMQEYATILKLYGLKSTQVRKTQMVPILANYVLLDDTDASSGLWLESVEMVDLDNIKDSQTYLLPVALDTQSTGFKKVDALLAALRNQYAKFIALKVDPSQQLIKEQQRDDLAIAIRKLHLQLDFEPLASIGTTFLKNTRALINTFSDLDVTTLSHGQLSAKLGQLLAAVDGASKYRNVTDVFDIVYRDRELNDEEKKVKIDLKRMEDNTSFILDEISILQRLITVQMANQEGFGSEDIEETEKNIRAGEEFNPAGSILNPERVISDFGKSLTEPSQLGSRIINFATSLFKTAKSEIDIEVSKLGNAYTKLLLPLEKLAQSRGVDAFSMIGKIVNGELELINKISDKFTESFDKAIYDQDKSFLLANLKKEEYLKEANLIIDTTAKEIRNTTYFDDVDRNEAEQERRIDNIKNRFILGREAFNGYTSQMFKDMYMRNMNVAKNLSDEYKAMPAEALPVWEFFENGLNQRAKEAGYIGKGKSSFFPLIEATILQKFASTGNYGTEIKDFFKDSYTVRVNEENTFDKIDPETNKVRMRVPKYFTRTDKQAYQLSTDLNKVGMLWIKSVLEYENVIKWENHMLTLLAVEASKPTLQVNEDNNLMMASGSPKLNYGLNKNAEMYQTLLNDWFYGVKQDSTTAGNILIDMANKNSGATAETIETRKVNQKKLFGTLSTWTQLLGTGLKLAIGIPNWFGNQFQTYINAGKKYRYREFIRQHARIMIPGALDRLELGILDILMPLNEDVAREKEREGGLKQSKLKWLGTFTFNEVMMSTSNYPERKVQYANALSFIENSMIKDGKIVNIREYVMNQDDAAMYAKDDSGKIIMSETKRKELKDSQQARIDALKESSSLVKSAKEVDDYTVIPGVSTKELAKFRTEIIDYGRNISGQVSEIDKPGYKRDVMWSAFMMFKGWIPKLVTYRAKGLKKNEATNEWEYGRTRLFFKTLQHLSLGNLGNITDIWVGNDKGLAIMDKILADKRNAYFEKTGEVLTITEAEFYSLTQKAISDQFKELNVVILTLALYFGGKLALDDDDDEDANKNGMKFIVKNLYKISEEVTFYYNPLSIEAISSGNFIPGIIIASKAVRAIKESSKFMVGEGIQNQEWIDEAHPVKYIFDIIPGPSQFQKEILPLIDPELAKEMGIKVTADVQRR